MPSIENDLGGDLLERLLDQDERERAMSKVQLAKRTAKHEVRVQLVNCLFGVWYIAKGISPHAYVVVQTAMVSHYLSLKLRMALLIYT